MSKLIKDMSHANIIYVDVPNDEFEAICDSVGGWADSENQCCTTFDNIEEAADDTNADDYGRAFAKEFMQTWKSKVLPRGCDVIIQKEDPK